MSTVTPCVEEIAAIVGELAVDPQQPQRITPELVRRIAATGALAAMVPEEYGGSPLTHVAYGDLNRIVAEVLPSVQSLLVVHAMACRVIARWATAETRAEFLPALATGDLVAAFAMSEDGAGSDIRRIATTAEFDDDTVVLDGHKKWITLGAYADLFVVFACSGRQDVAVLVRRDDPGVKPVAMADLSGFSGALLGELHLSGCRVPGQRVLGRPGTALSHVAADGLMLGRLCVAYGALGIARAARDAALGRAITRHQFSGALHRLQLVRGMLSDAVVATDAAQLLCERAARALDNNDEWATSHVLTAKLAASRAASRAAATAAQLHGAAGLIAGSAVDRYVRDARVTEIIEGNTQLMQHLVAGQALARYRAEAAPARPGDTRNGDTDDR